MGDEHETELDKAITATIAIALLDGPHKRDRLERSIVRLLSAAAADGGERLHGARIHEARAVIRASTYAAYFAMRAYGFRGAELGADDQREIFDRIHTEAEHIANEAAKRITT